MKQNETFFSLLVLSAAILWGTTGTAQSFIASGVSPLSVGSVRLTIGGAALLLFAWKKGVLVNRSLWHSRSTIIAAACISAYQLLFFAGVLHTGVAVGTVVTIGSAPVFAGLISRFIKKENLGINWTIATMVSIAGCIMLITGGQDELSVNPVGILLALGAGAFYAFYTAISKKLLETFPAEAVTGVVFFIGALLISPFLFLYRLEWLWTIQGSLVALHLGLLTTALAYVLFSYGLSKISFPKAVTLSLAEPITAALLGVFLLKEQLTLISKTGMLFVFLGLVILSLANVKKRSN